MLYHCVHTFCLVHHVHYCRGQRVEGESSPKKSFSTSSSVLSCSVLCLVETVTDWVTTAGLPADLTAFGIFGVLPPSDRAPVLTECNISPSLWWIECNLSDD